MYSAVSKNGVPIRLPDERWVHITEEHSELAGHLYDVLETVSDPAAVYRGTAGDLLAVRQVAGGRHLVAVYKEISPSDGFVITAFLTRRLQQLERRQQLWPS